MCIPLWPVGVLSEEQIRLKKMKKQHEEETARSSTVVTPTPPLEAVALDPQQQEMIEKLVAMQKQCNKRSFLDRPKVTVSEHLWMDRSVDLGCSDQFRAFHVILLPNSVGLLKTTRIRNQIWIPSNGWLFVTINLDVNKSFSEGGQYACRTWQLYQKNSCCRDKVSLLCWGVEVNWESQTPVNVWSKTWFEHLCSPGSTSHMLCLMLCWFINSSGDVHSLLTISYICVCIQQPWPQSQDLQNREVRQQRFAHFTELAIMSVQEIVDFAKQLPGFLELTREDQIALLKTSTIEVCHDLLVYKYLFSWYCSFRFKRFSELSVQALELYITYLKTALTRLCHK